jgi:hypothetical protein
MPFVPLPLLEAAIEGLQGKHPLPVLVLPTMVLTGLRVVESADDGHPYGSRDELGVLREYFSVPGALLSKPFRAVWESRPSDFWRNERYAGRSLQRTRTDMVKAGRGFFQKKPDRGPDLWGLRPNCGAELESLPNNPVRLVDLAIWYGRTWDAADLDELISTFLSPHRFPLDQDDLINTVYTLEVPTHYRQIPFSPQPISPAELAEATGAAPPPPAVGTNLDGLVARLDGCIRAKGFQLEPGFVRRVLSAWMRGDIVILMGQPGTGKTRFAALIAECLKNVFEDLVAVWIPVRTNFEEADLIGYERLDGTPELREFATRVLKSEEPLGPHLLILEEFNLAAVETYLSPILVALQEPDRRVRLPAGEEVHLPIDTFILATCNPFRDEPETRLPVSFPSKRRASVLSMPNVLADRYEADGDVAILALAIEMIAQERVAIEDRAHHGLATALDALRSPALSSVRETIDFSIEFQTALIRVSKALLDSPEGRSFFTLGLLRDLALEGAYAARSPSAELAALGNQVADKVVHQLRGVKERADELSAASVDLPNRQEIDRLLERMKSPPVDELVQFL